MDDNLRHYATTGYVVFPRNKTHPKKDRVTDIKDGKEFLYDCRGANLTAFDLGDRQLSDSNFRKAILIQANMSKSSFNKAMLSATDMRDANCQDSSFVAASFVRSDLTNANFSGANLKNVNMAHAILTGTDFSYANILAANFTNANIENAIFHGLIFLDRVRHFKSRKLMVWTSILGGLVIKVDTAYYAGEDAFQQLLAENVQTLKKTGVGLALRDRISIYYLEAIWGLYREHIGYPCAS
jgi:uncharacterized protein YjbI with pentapeptide repeats